MMTLPVWLPGSMFLWGVCLWSHVPSRGLCPEGLPDRDPPGQRPPWRETPLDRDLLDRELPGQRLPWRDSLRQFPSPDRDASYWNAMHTCLFSVFNLTTIHHCGIRALFVRFLKLKAGQTRPSFN